MWLQDHLSARRRQHRVQPANRRRWTKVSRRPVDWQTTLVVAAAVFQEDSAAVVVDTCAVAMMGLAIHVAQITDDTNLSTARTGATSTMTCVVDDRQ